MTEVQVIGAGLAGLAAAVALAQAGRSVTVYEAGPAAGGRCRSYFDRELGCRVDNGNHLLLSGNRAALAYLDRIGARATLGGPGRAVFPFIDRTDGARWTLRPSPGRIPWWVLRAATRVPGTRLADYLDLLALRRCGSASVVAALRPGVLYQRLLEPLAIAALNTPPDEALGRLLGAVMAETLMQGGAACVPLLPRAGLSESFVDPALAWLGARGHRVLTGCRVAALRIEGGRVVALDTAAGTVPAGLVVLATPAPVAADLLPGLTAPDRFQTIVNVHFRIEPVPPADIAAAGFAGVVGGVAEWVFVKPGHVSVTISAANRLADRPAEDLAGAVWPDVCAALELAGPMPPWRVVKERRATIAATAAQEALRPGTRTALGNLALAGDWTATGLPGTIEGAIRSGDTAARVLLSLQPAA